MGTCSLVFLHINLSSPTTDSCIVVVEKVACGKEIINCKFLRNWNWAPSRRSRYLQTYYIIGNVIRVGKEQGTLEGPAIGLL